MGDAEVTAVEVRDIAKSFGGVAALQEVSLVVPRGVVFSVIGPNGAGKSTLFDIITGLTSPDDGSVYFMSVDVTRLRPDERARRGMARTFQELRLFGDLTAFENIYLAPLTIGSSGLFATMLGSRESRAERDRARDVADGLLHRFKLEHRRDVPASQLSHGQKRLVELARALALAPRVLILDEPTAGLNAENKRLFVDVVLPSLREGIETVLLIEHDMDVVMECSDRVAVLAHGRKISEGTPLHVQSDQGVVREYFGT